MGAAGQGPCTTSGGNHADRARNRRGTAACRRLHLRPDCGAAGYFGAHRDQPHQERIPQARRAFGRGSRDARGAAAPARGRSIMTPADYVINLTLSVILIVGAYQFYFWCQRNHLSAARELGSRIDERIPYWPSWVWIYSCIYYPLILYLNFVVESPRHFTHIAMSYMLLLGLQMAFFVLFPVTTPPHWRAYNRQRSPSERFLALVQRFEARSNELEAAVEVHDLAAGEACGDAASISFLQRRASQDGVFFSSQDAVQRLEPRPAIRVVERDAGGHLRHVRGRVVAVGVDKAPAELEGERLADRGLAHARDPHHHHDHGRLWTAWPPKRVRIMASSLRAWSERPWLEKRDISAVMITGAGTPSSIDSTAVQRPAPDSSTTGAMPERSSFSLRMAPHRSSSQDRTTLPWRQVSASRAGSMSSSGRAAMSAKPSASACIMPYSMPLWIILA